MKNTNEKSEPSHCISVEYGVEGPDLPSAEQIRGWVRNALTDVDPAVSVDLRIVDRDEIQQANRRYRAQDRPTNVLSFPAELPLGVPVNHLGDIMISAPVVAAEARSQGKSVQAHWAHLVTHGVLHLLGYDHQRLETARVMEALETRILNRIGVQCPYD